VATLCVGNNIFNILSKRRSHNRGGGGGGGSSVLGEAFQSSVQKIRQNKQYGFWSVFGSSNEIDVSFQVPKDNLQPFGSYPNILNITADMRKEFHPVVKIPLRKDKKGVAAAEGTESESEHRSIWPWKRRKSKNINNDNAITVDESDPSCIAMEEPKMNETYDYILKDYTGNTQNDNTVLLQDGTRAPQLASNREEALEYAKNPKKSKQFDVGRYDEDRRMMYTSSLFLDEGNTNKKDRRTVHLGLDIGAPVGTSVYAPTDGIVHSVGYNAEIGDYGHVIVIEHSIGSAKVYALYGHLGAKSIQGKYPGQTIRKGQVIGYVGNVAENGGWTGTHLHFQLALNAPKTHDMPGVVALKDREEALLEYLDPRYVLGQLY